MKAFFSFFICLLLVLTVSCHVNLSLAQTADFEFVHDTVCVGEIVKLNNLSTGAYSYTWNFEPYEYGHDLLELNRISEYKYADVPQDKRMRTHLDRLVKQDSNYYSFIIKRYSEFKPNSVNGTTKLFRYSFGNDLRSYPKEDTIWSLNDIATTNIDIQKGENNEWYGFYVQSYFHPSANNLLIRLNFGNSLTNAPSVDTIMEMPFHHLNYDGRSKDLKLICDYNKWYLHLHQPIVSYNYDSTWYHCIIRFNDGLGGHPTSITLDTIPYSLPGEWYMSEPLPNYYIWSDANVYYKENEKWYVCQFASNSYYVEAKAGMSVIEFDANFQNPVQYFLYEDTIFSIYYHQEFPDFNRCGDLFKLESYGMYDYNVYRYFDTLYSYSYNNYMTEMADTIGAVPDNYRLKNISNIYRFVNETPAIVMSTRDNGFDYLTLLFLRNKGPVIGDPDVNAFEPEFAYDTAGTFKLSLTINNDIATTVCKEITVLYPPIIDSIRHQWVSECDTSDGFIEIFASDLTNQLQYSIDSGYSYFYNDVFDSLKMGNYYVSVGYGNNECKTALDTVVIISSIHAPRIDSILTKDITKCSFVDGEISVFASRGDSTFQFTINGDIWEPQSIFSGLSKGNYYVGVRKEDSTCSIIHPYPISIIEPAWPNFDTVFLSNPTDCDALDGVIQVVGSGNESLLYKLDTGEWTPIFMFSGLPEGNYELQMKYISDNCEVTKMVSLKEPVRPIIKNVELAHQSSCFHPNGMIFLMATDGIPPLQYTFDGVTWDNLAGYSNISSDTFFVGVRNANGTCEYLDTVPKIVEERCRDSIFQEICRDGSWFNLDTLLPKMIIDTGNWIDHQNTGALTLSMLRSGDIPPGEYDFSFVAGGNNIKAHIIACAKMATGNIVDENIFCNDTINLFSSLVPGSYDTNGVWFILPDMDTVNEIFYGEKGNLQFKYYFPEIYPCPEVNTDVELYIDDQPPELWCDSIQYLSFITPPGRNAYQLNQNYAPTVKEWSCNEFSLTNSYNNQSTLLGVNFQKGTHYINWTVVDYAGNQTDCETEVKVRLFQVPNLITPNGDGSNDTWIVNVSKEYPNAEIYVYDRWGNLVYGSKNGFANWDGKINGNLVAVDSYQFVIMDDNKKIYDGSLTIWY